MRISIFGLGYVGAVSLACLARDGHEVIGVDIDESKLDLIRRGQSPIVEEGIQELMEGAVGSGRVSLTSDAREAIHACELSFVCVGTPASPNGSQDLSAIERLSRQIGEALRDREGFHVVVVRSTVRPGTVHELVQPAIEESSGRRAGDGYALVFQPEFLREGSSVRDYDNPPFTVVGSEDDRAVEVLREAFGHLPAEFVHTDVRTAEMLKYACNTFHALKITFANEIGRISKSLGVDSREVMRLVCEDRQLNISPAYLLPGFAFGGSCLPKDLKALLYAAKQLDVDLPMLSGVLPSNHVHIDRAIDRVLETGKRKIGMMGLSFKTGTDDLRESPLVILAERFIGKGLDLRVYDPEVSLARLVGANRRYIEESIPHISSLMCDSHDELLDHAEVLVLGLMDEALLVKLRARSGDEPFVIDLVDTRQHLGDRAAYDGLCW